MLFRSLSWEGKEMDEDFLKTQQSFSFCPYASLQIISGDDLVPNKRYDGGPRACYGYIDQRMVFATPNRYGYLYLTSDFRFQEEI